MEVTLLTQEDCAFCDQARSILDRLAREHALTVRVLDLASPEGRSIAERAGILFPPGILLDGDPVSFGRPSEKRLRREIERRSRSSSQEAR